MADEKHFKNRDFKITHGALLILEDDVAIFSCPVLHLKGVGYSKNTIKFVIDGSKTRPSFELNSEADCVLLTQSLYEETEKVRNIVLEGTRRTAKSITEIGGQR